MSALTTRLYSVIRIEKASRLPYALLAAWLLSMIALPIARWVYGDSAIPVGVTLSAVLQAAAVLVILHSAWGARRVAALAAVVIGLAWLVEFTGSQTGVPFGRYHYTERLQPQLLGVPLLIPLAWLMMLPCAWAVAQAITGKTRGFAFVSVSALAFTAWDLFLDPQMVAWDFWTWEHPGAYFGIPLVNFAGWLLASALMTWVARPAALPLFPLIGIYALTWALESIGQAVFWELPGSAAFGFVGMGALLLWALRVLRREQAA